MKKLFVYTLLILISHKAKTQTVDSSLVSVLKVEKPFLLYGRKSGRLTICLQTIHVQKEVFWLGFSIRNSSGLSYPIDLIRFYLRDLTRARRSSAQELEIVPLYADAVRLVPARSTIRFLVAVPKFTIPDHKVCVIEMFETNGGRNLSFSISNRQLFLARPIPDHSKNNNDEPLQN